jgi:multicomponent Na+:H+ antiporter subunit G
MDNFLYFIHLVLICLGALFCLIGAIGLIRMPDFFTKMHASSLIETLAAGFILLGLMFESGFSLITVKLFFIGLLILFTGPTATHALARAAIIRGLDPRKDDQRSKS